MRDFQEWVYLRRTAFASRLVHRQLTLHRERSLRNLGGSRWVSHTPSSAAAGGMMIVRMRMVSSVLTGRAQTTPSVSTIGETS